MLLKNDFSLGGSAVTIFCHLRILLARVNVERATQGKPTLSLRRLAGESGVSLSTLAALNTGRTQRIDYITIDRLLNYFSSYFSVTTDDLLTWEAAKDHTISRAWHPQGVPLHATPQRISRE